MTVTGVVTAAARGCAGGGAGGWVVAAGGGAKLGAEPLGPVNPIWAKAPAEDEARSAKAESRVRVRTDSIGAVFLRSWGDCKAGCSHPETPRPFGLLGFPLG